MASMEHLSRNIRMLLAEWDAIATAPAGPVGWEVWQQRRIAADLWTRSALAAMAGTRQAVEC